MKKAIAIALCLLAVGLSACTGSVETTTEGEETMTETEKTTAEETTEEETFAYPVAENGVYKLTDLKGWIKLNGRQYFAENGLTADWSGGGFSVNVKTEGTKMIFDISADYRCCFAVHVDGVEVARPQLEQGDVQVEAEIPAGEHTVTIYKENGVNNEGKKTVTITGLSFEGEFLKPEPKKDLYIEVVGDSISCGLGSLGVYTAGQKWELPDHSYTHSFTYYLSKKLDADVELCGIGGIGIAKEVGGFTIDTLYDGLCFYRGDRKANTYTREPNIIVIEIGANDTSVTDEREFREKMRKFILAIHEKHPNSALIWAGRSERNYGAIKTIISEENLENMFAVIHNYGGKGSAALTTQTAGHPDAAGQEGFADAIVKVIREKILTD